MRLIDADEFKKQVAAMAIKESYDVKKVNAMIGLIDNQPTAYDVDRVVEKLGEERRDLLESHDYENDVVNYCLSWFDNAIDIVKGAAKDE